VGAEPIESLTSGEPDRQLGGLPTLPASWSATYERVVATVEAVLGRSESKGRFM
jgi:hypothetical protein